ncbi:MAG: mannitol dehydrogenase [Clostridiales bacterium]|nr:mannitol dehydrogenase [Clostridiales bacterium]
MKKFIMYGAGNIGRGFIGQLFSNSGYQVGFIDINQEVIARLNSDKQYPVNVVSNDGIEEQIVKNVYGIDGKDVELVSNEIASCDIMATAIGVNVLKFIVKPISLGIKKRFEQNKEPLNIIICENLIGADQYLKGLIKEQLPEYSDRIDKEIGFVEASIGRMVPVVPEDKKLGNPLRVYVEPYNILPVDKDAFKGEIPDVQNLYPYTPFNLFIQRKLFMHNMSHATCAYLGYLRNYEYIYQAIADYDIKCVAFKALVQSALAISRENKVDIDMLLDHAENLLYRFANVELGDTVARVGKDTKRKLSSNDRLIGAIKLTEKHNLPNEYLCLGVACAMAFEPIDDENSQELSSFVKEFGVKETLKKYSDYDGEKTKFIAQLYQDIKDGKSIQDLIKSCEIKAGKTIRV